MVKLEQLGVHGKDDGSAVASPVHYLHELPFAEEQRLEELFKTLDKDSNGRIDIHDLSEALKELGLCGTYAEVSRGWRLDRRNCTHSNESSNSVAFCLTRGIQSCSSLLVNGELIAERERPTASLGLKYVANSRNTQFCNVYLQTDPFDLQLRTTVSESSFT